MLNQQVSFVLAEQEVAKRGIEVTDTDISSAEAALANDLTTTTATDTSGSVADDGTGAQSLTDLGPFKDTLVKGIANILALRADFAAELSTDEALQKAFDESGDTYKNQACASVILLLAGQGPTQDPTTGAAVPPPDSDFATALDKANGLSDQLGQGADFATLAKSSSDDSQTGANGGDLGCNPVGTYAQQQPEIDDAITNQALGKAGEPVKTNFGYAIVLVRSRGDLTFDEAKSQLKAAVPTLARTAFQDWFVAAAKAATVTVDPQYGSWDAEHRHGRPARGGHHLDHGVDRRSVGRPALLARRPQRSHRLLHHVHALSSTGSVVPARIAVVGLGPAGPDLVTAGALARIASADRCVLRTERHPAASVVPGASSFDHVYDQGDTLEAVYRQIVDEVVALALTLDGGRARLRRAGLARGRRAHRRAAPGRGRRGVTIWRSRSCRRCRSSIWPGRGSASTRSPGRCGWSTASASTSMQRGSGGRC